jgi:uncharacterized membrane protein YqjE
VSTSDKLQDLVHRLAEDTAALVRSEIELAKTELRESLTGLAKGLAFGVAAAAFGVLAVFALIQAAIFGLGEAMPLWASGLIVGGVLLALAALGGLLALRAVKRSKSPVPTQAVKEAQATVDKLRGARA